jgi:SAM-dependent methyltransferase
MSDIKSLFRAERLAEYDFSRAPEVVRRIACGAATQAREGLELAEWERVQARFVDHAQRDPEDLEARRESVEAYGRFFRTRGPLAGSVLDIGGGSGLYRQWWEGGVADVYVVHDPAPEFFSTRSEDRERLRRFYPRAFSLPATYVEGIGEDLPYRDETFDTCFMVATLDHCAQPARVVAEAHRCLRPGGAILIFQTCRLPAAAQRARYSLVLALRRPRRLFRKLRDRLVGRPPKHLHRFDVPRVVALLEGAGFADLRVSAEPLKKRVFAFQARKSASPGE